VTRYPTITFRSTAVAAGRPGWQVSGELTVRDITRPLIVDVVDVVVGGVAHDRVSGATRAGLRGTVRVDRSRFGLSAFGLGAATSLPGSGQFLSKILALDLALNATRLNRDMGRPAAA
jgi:polyisoprenoid-binding protein YceI